MRSCCYLLIYCLCYLGTACKKSDNEKVENFGNREDVYVANSVLGIELLLNELEFIVRQADQNNIAGNFQGCATLNPLQDTNSDGFELRFGGAVCDDKTLRSGTLVFQRLQSSGGMIVHSEGYIMNGVQISGEFRFQPGVYQQKEVLNVIVNNAKLTDSAGNFNRFSAERTSFFKSGKSTLTISDDLFETLYATYELELKAAPFAYSVSAKSIAPYLRKFSCTEHFRPRSGKIRFEMPSGDARYIIFGAGNCSDQAVISQNP